MTFFFNVGSFVLCAGVAVSVTLVMSVVFKQILMSISEYIVSYQIRMAAFEGNGVHRCSPCHRCSGTIVGEVVTERTWAGLLGFGC